MLKFITHPKTVVITGIVLTILSAILSHQEVNNNERQIRTIEATILSNKNAIDNFWQQRQLLERRKDIATLLLVQVNASSTSNSQNIIENYFNETLHMAHYEGTTNLTLEQLDNAIVLFTNNLTKQIDNLYIENISLHDRVMALNTQNSTTKGIALFFQILGMILVLSYNVWDYTRRPSR